MVPTILIFSIVMGADYSFELISIVHWVPQFIMHNRSILGGVSHCQLSYYLKFFSPIINMFLCFAVAKKSPSTHFHRRGSNLWRFDRNKLVGQWISQRNPGWDCWCSRISGFNPSWSAPFFRWSHHSGSHWIKVIRVLIKFELILTLTGPMF